MIVLAGLIPVVVLSKTISYSSVTETKSRLILVPNLIDTASWSMPHILKVDDISCQYKSESAVNHTSFDLEEGTLACLLGPSGCGKTTVLRAITGFQKLTGGSITLNDICISSTRINIPPEKRNISMVFQDYALFPHLTVEKNIEAGAIQERSVIQKSSC